MRGGYVVARDSNPDVVLVGNGAEVATLVAAADIIAAHGVNAQIVSIPSIGLSLNQDEKYRKEVIPPSVPAFGLTSGLPSTLLRVIPDANIYGLDHFGASAPYKVLDEKFGFTPQNIALLILKMLK